MRTILITVLFALALQAQPQVEHIPWNQSAERLAGRFVSVHLTSGTRISGSWASVTPTTFTMNVEKTSNKSQLRKGLQTVPRTSIQQVSARKRRIRGRVIGTLAGFYVVAGIAAAATGSGEALQGAFGLAAYGAGVGGYFLGKSYDYTSTQIVLRD